MRERLRTHSIVLMETLETRSLLSAAPTVTAQPSNQSITAGKTAHFTALAAGDAPLSVQWQVRPDFGKKFSDITGNASAHSVTLTLPHVAALKNLGEYRAVFTNAQGVVITQPATLSITTAGPIALITPAHAKPASVTGTTAMLAASATLGQGDLALGDASLKYSWSVLQSPGSAHPPVFSVNNTSAARSTRVTFQRAGSYTFRCTIRDRAGHAMTTDVAVVVRLVAFRLFFRDVPQVIDPGERFTYKADVYDQFHHALLHQPPIHYRIKFGDGFIDSSDGTYYAPDHGDEVALEASAEGLSDTFYLSVNDPTPVDTTPPDLGTP